jgi:NADH-quinone oxidoreductase subunit N
MIKAADLYLLLPQIIVAVAAIVAMLSVAIKRNHLFTCIFTLVALVIAFISIYLVPAEGAVTKLFMVDGFSLFFTGLILCASFIVTFMSYHYFKAQQIQSEEYYVLLLLATLGSIAMVISNHFISFLLSLEVLSVSLFALIGYLKRKDFAIEAGIKYLILAAVSTSILLFGVALIYAGTGHLDLAGLSATSAVSNSSGFLLIAGLALVIVGIGFKMALAPFHLWTPDIYSGASAPVSAFVATISKGAAFAFLIRLFYSIGGLKNESVWLAFAVIAAASMLFGNWLALRQQNIKRLLAYSSISHLGYMMVAFLALGKMGIQASAFYLVVYFVSMLGAFGTVIYLSGKDSEAINIEDYRGLFWTKPWLAALFTVVMLSLAGIPLTAGFMGKFYLLTAGTGSGLWALVIILVISSGIGLFYYLRVVATMFSGQKETSSETAAANPVFIGENSFPLKLVLSVVFILLLWFGIYPSSLLDVLQQMISGIF